MELDGCVGLKGVGGAPESVSSAGAQTAARQLFTVIRRGCEKAHHF